MTPSEIAAWHDGAAAWMESREDFHIQAAATIRAQAEALKIATEALEVIMDDEGGREPIARQALARVKERT